jgi:o-succinylbenzoate---CoA ligase
MTAFLHPEFKIDNLSYTKEALLLLAHEYINDAAIYKKNMGVFLLEWFDDAEFITLQTSGSTGVPKQIEVRKQAMIHSAKATGAFFNLGAGNTALCCLPMQYIAGKMMLVRALVLGLQIEVIEATANPLENTTKRYDFAAMVPLQAQNSLSGLQNIKTLIIGGAKIDETLKKQLTQIPISIYETYGMTETVSHVAVRTMKEAAFKLLPHVKISRDDRNCLIINAPQLSDGSIITNDLVEITSNTTFLLLGRYDNIINSGGIKLIPEVIENKLTPFLKQRFFICGVPDAVLGEKVVLVVEGPETKLPSSIFETLTKFEKPKAVVFVEKLKETGNGKIIRKL